MIEIILHPTELLHLWLPGMAGLPIDPSCSIVPKFLWIPSKADTDISVDAQSQRCSCDIKTFSRNVQGSSEVSVCVHKKLIYRKRNVCHVTEDTSYMTHYT